MKDKILKQVTLLLPETLNKAIINATESGIYSKAINNFINTPLGKAYEQIFLGNSEKDPASDIHKYLETKLKLCLTHEQYSSTNGMKAFWSIDYWTKHIEIGLNMLTSEELKTIDPDITLTTLLENVFTKASTLPNYVGERSLSSTTIENKPLSFRNSSVIATVGENCL